MSKTKGSKNYFQGDKLYILKDVLDYIRKNEPSLEIPQSWEHGGGLNDLAKKFGIVPDYDNGIEGRGHFTKYKGTTLYKFAALVVDYLKNITPKKPRLTPIEVITKMAQKDIEKAADEVFGCDPSSIVIKSGSVSSHPEEEPENELRIPTGFFEVHGTKGERLLVRFSDVKQVCEMVPGCRFTASYLIDEERNSKTIIFAKHTLCVVDTYDEIIKKINDAITPRISINSSGLTLFGSEV